MEVTITASGRRLTLAGSVPEYLQPMSDWNADSGVVAQVTKDLPRGALCLDIGANIGATAVPLAVQRADCRIVAFEPVPENAEFLRANLRVNRIENVEVVEAAVSDVAGVLPLSNNGPYSMVAPGSNLHCRSVTLDEYVREPVAFIKIDVEGYEPNVFAGARRVFAEHRPLVLIEFNTWCMLVHGYNPVAFSAAIWSACDVLALYFMDQALPAPGNPHELAHQNIVAHGSVTDVLLRPRTELPGLDDMAYGPEVARLRRELTALREAQTVRQTR
ncbi:MAG TPA: FkbM family methyltransferase [Bryobacteraceae bacterium]|nr:FkbM family methyltransferase [Bryobacteraceae bacterium]